MPLFTMSLAAHVPQRIEDLPDVVFLSKLSKKKKLKKLSNLSKIKIRNNNFKTYIITRVQPKLCQITSASGFCHLDF